MGCNCPDPVQCDLCDSFEDVEVEQGVALCGKCLIGRSYETSSIESW